jgi:hypothetical protein
MAAPMCRHLWSAPSRLPIQDPSVFTRADILIVSDGEFGVTPATLDMHFGGSKKLAADCGCMAS